MAFTTSKIVTCQEWLQMPEAEGREEVVAREIIKMPPARFEHASMVHTLQMMLANQLDAKEIWVMTTIFGLVIREDTLTCRQPGLAIFIRKNMVLRDGKVRTVKIVNSGELRP